MVHRPGQLVLDVGEAVGAGPQGLLQGGDRVAMAFTIELGQPAVQVVEPRALGVPLGDQLGALRGPRSRACSWARLLLGRGLAMASNAASIMALNAGSASSRSAIASTHARRLSGSTGTEFEGERRRAWAPTVGWLGEPDAIRGWCHREPDAAKGVI